MPNRTPRIKFYRLNYKNEVVSCDIGKLPYQGQIVQKTNLMVANVQCEVSTVFMPIDHRFPLKDNEGPPIVFETMIFGGVFDGYQDRYCTWDEAKKGHAETVVMATNDKKIVLQTISVVSHWFSNKWWNFKHFLRGE